ncbi:hypothetical protein [Pseudarthrobacter oxydans]|uniref:hypothetical protein n=1 Tax=Pseudarthrobacter oxydans TaxID=1671 RepID=UPI002AA788E6|nr:hypothetical protein [Pseudarthrobacter oxydans]WPU08099.1 hypothetical protein SMD14_13090 [Pseudarthrobacter oxydans]
MRLLISTGGVVASGLVGAGITAYSTNRNAARTHHAQRVMWELEKDHTRQESLRIQKEEDYRNLLLSMDEYQVLVTKAFTAEPIEWDLQHAMEAEVRFKAAAAHVALFNDDPKLQEALDSATWQLSSVAELVQRAATNHKEIQQDTLHWFPVNMDTHRKQILDALRHDLRETDSQRHPTPRHSLTDGQTPTEDLPKA